MTSSAAVSAGSTSGTTLATGSAAAETSKRRRSILNGKSCLAMTPSCKLRAGASRYVCHCWPHRRFRSYQPARSKVVCRPRGLYRTPGWAYVTDSIMTFDITESDYRRSAYKPDYDALPSKRDYDAAVEARRAGEKDGNA